jgi:hypothetical protein
MDAQLEMLENSDGDEQLALAAGAPERQGDDPAPNESSREGFCVEVRGVHADDLSQSEREALTAQTANFLLINCDKPVEEVQIAHNE